MMYPDSGNSVIMVAARFLMPSIHEDTLKEIVIGFIESNDHAFQYKNEHWFYRGCVIGKLAPGKLVVYKVLSEVSVYEVGTSGTFNEAMIICDQQKSKVTFDVFVGMAKGFINKYRNAQDKP